MDTIKTNAHPIPTEKNRIWSRLKKPGKQMFWAWIAYQTIKGSLTTAFIWIPLLYMWFQ